MQLIVLMISRRPAASYPTKMAIDRLRNTYTVWRFHKRAHREVGCKGSPILLVIPPKDGYLHISHVISTI